MKLIKKLVAAVIIVIILGLALSFWGLPLPQKYSKGECSSSYKKFLFPRISCAITKEHCESNEFLLDKAKYEVAGCLCDKYLKNPSADTSDDIKSICSETYCGKYAKTYDCVYYFDRAECPYEDVLPDTEILCRIPSFFDAPFID